MRIFLNNQIKFVHLLNPSIVGFIKFKHALDITLHGPLFFTKLATSRCNHTHNHNPQTIKTPILIYNHNFSRILRMNQITFHKIILVFGIM
jgi:hypothetical protein